MAKEDSIKGFFQDWLLKEGNFISAFIFTVVVYIIFGLDWKFLGDGEIESTGINYLYILYIYLASVLNLFLIGYIIYDREIMSYSYNKDKFKTFIMRAWNPFLNIGMVFNTVFIFIGYVISLERGLFGRFVDGNLELIEKISK